jgi:D-lactate dehydrogenase
MKMAVFNTKPYDREFLEIANRQHNHSLTFFETHLKRETVSLARGFPAVCIFVNDRIDTPMFEALATNGTRLVALRCSGFNNVDLVEAEKHEIMVVRVPAYSPYAVAEHTIALLLGLNRKLHKSYARVREGNFALDGLLGYDVHGRTAGIIGTGRIGMVVAKILHGFGCSLKAYDPHRNAECERYGVRYTSLNELLSDSDIITLHCPLTPETHHIIDSSAVEQMKHGVILINTSRGALIDTRAIIRGLKSGKISQLGLDVYEEEADLFFEDLSDKVIQDDVFARLLTFPNVVVTGHQAYFTREALMNIAEVTLANIQEYEKTGTCSNRVTAREVKG